jgi:hypothetical protein
MVSGSIDIDPQSLVRAGSTLASVTEQMATALQQLQSTVTGSGNPWGGDEQGTLFAGIYGAVLGHALESIDSYVEQMGYAAVGLSQQAHAIVHVDNAAAVGFHEVGPGSGG